MSATVAGHDSIAITGILKKIARILPDMYFIRFGLGACAA